MVPALAVVAVVSLLELPLAVPAAGEDSVRVPAPWVPRAGAPPRTRKLELPPDSLPSYMRAGLAPERDLADAWKLRARLRESHRQRVWVGGRVHESGGLTAGPAGLHETRAERRGVPPAPEFAWSEVERVEVRPLDPSPLDGLGEVLGYLNFIPAGIAGGVAAGATDGNQAAKEKAAGEAMWAALGITAAVGLAGETVGDLFLRRPGAWDLAYAPPGGGAVAVVDPAARAALWKLWLGMERQRRVRVTLNGGEVLEVNGWEPLAGGFRALEYHRRRHEPAREIPLAAVERIEVLRAPGTGGPAPRPGRNLTGALFAAGWITGAAVTADDGHEFTQNFVGAGVATMAGVLALAVLWLGPYHLLSHWETIHGGP